MHRYETHLLVDDVSTNLKCEELILHNQYKVTMVKSGEDALRYLESTIPDLILLDIHLSRMDGFEVMEHMRKDPKTASIPVIFLTADDHVDVERSLALGSVDFIRKPFDPQTLLDKIQAVWRTEAQ